MIPTLNFQLNDDRSEVQAPLGQTEPVQTTARSEMQPPMKKNKIVRMLGKAKTLPAEQLKKPKGKVSKVIGGHLMAIRDKRRATVMQHHLFDHSKYFLV